MVIAVSLFGERPDIYSTIGTAAIIAGCVLSMRRLAPSETGAFVAGMAARILGKAATRERAEVTSETSSNKKCAR